MSTSTKVPEHLLKGVSTPVNGDQGKAVGVKSDLSFGLLSILELASPLITQVQALADQVATNKTATDADAAATAADRITVAADKATVIADLATVVADLATVVGDVTTVGAAVTAAAASAALAAGAVGFTWSFASSTTMAAPGTGNVRLNNATPASVTALAISALTADTGNPNVLAHLDTWDDSTSTANRGYLTIRKLAAPATWAQYYVSGAVTDNTTWAQVPLTYVAGAGTFAAADQLGVSFVRTGDAGNLSDPTTTRGDLIVRGASAIQRLAIGAAHTMPISDGTDLIMRVLAGADLPNPAAATLGGVKSLAVVATKFLTGIGTDGAVTQAQPAFTDLSGSIAAAQLPNPAAATLGGVKSLAAVTHRFLTSIGTDGVPVAAQPDYADLTGTPPSGGALTVVSTLTANNTSPYFTFTGLATNRRYRLLITDPRPASSSWSGMICQLGQGGGPTWKTSNYYYDEFSQNTGGTSSGTSTSAAGVLFFNNYGLASTDAGGTLIEIEFGDVTSVSSFKNVLGDLVQYTASSVQTVRSIFGGTYKGDTNAITAIRVGDPAGAINILTGYAVLLAYSN